ncbi:MULTISPECIES: TetR/AcrR family transcriptional regulator [unclassified Methylobacterium]|jgi:AcrR family transcriptional regulator|uniref:TetR/AcrR family transcriptional regulator n=1 Tax=unclassified Methylobacterium TaxID=2615210 RepID=UPI001354706F|nr:TetR/AcrR family transcriptional regulator [Methylobacterium sp. 2A]MWV25694.1 TetR/AcrR family transcriptional regulator [Methylobacterium sp. 2A]
MPAARGRPRSFDRGWALQRLLDVFWSKGFEGAQIGDLTAAIGVAPPSFYAAFGSKEAAFREAVDLYIATVGAAPMQALEDAPTARAGLRAMLEGSIDVALSNRSGGCLLILGVVSSLPASDNPRAHLLRARRKTLALIRDRLERARDTGDLPPEADPARLAAFYHGIMQAISFQARDGASREALQALIEPALAALRAA